ncbi:unnamed protein product [Urochloa humidicola]
MATNYYQNGNPYPYYQQPHPSDVLWRYKVAGAVVVGLAAITLLAKLLHFWLRSLKDAGRSDRRRVPPPRSDGGGRDSTRQQPQLQPPAPAPVAGEMMRSVGPLVCTYRRADGWREAACAVCLAELADGEAVRVLPACMHYFHAECVGEWLLAHATCPLCRAPLDPVAAV